MNPPFDLAHVRAQFPAFAEPGLAGQAFFENAGGSFCCAQVSARLAEYYRRLRLQPYYPYPASMEAGAWMDASHARLAEYLGVSADEVHFGPSTSQNSYVLAQALRRSLKAGDEIVVSNQEHEANSGAWRRLAEFGVVVREWRMDRETAALDPAALGPLLTDRTRLVAFTHCSNVVGHINPVSEICARVRAAGALSVVDGVAFAPHGLPDVRALGADIYLFSLYKTYGPHQGLMAIRAPVLERLGNEGHYFNAAYPRKRLVPAGPDHAQIASAQGIPEYFDALDAHHGGGAVAGRPQRVRELLRSAEMRLVAPLLDYLRGHRGVRLVGPADPRVRAPTLSFVPFQATPAAVQAALAAHGVLCAAGHFYAVRLLEALGIDPQRGVVRLSLVHYNSPEEVARALTALDAALGASG
jgi:cysteine desulfurase family protein (TIGR01976 family)